MYGPKLLNISVFKKPFTESKMFATVSKGIFILDLGETRTFLYISFLSSYMSEISSV